MSMRFGWSFSICFYIIFKVNMFSVRPLRGTRLLNLKEKENSHVNSARMQYPRRPLLLGGKTRLGAARSGRHGEDRDHRRGATHVEGHYQCHAERGGAHRAERQERGDVGKRQVGGTCHVASDR